MKNKIIRHTPSRQRNYVQPTQTTSPFQNNKENIDNNTSIIQFKRKGRSKEINNLQCKEYYIKNHEKQPQTAITKTQFDDQVKMSINLQQQKVRSQSQENLLSIYQSQQSLIKKSIEIKRDSNLRSSQQQLLNSNIVIQNQNIQPTQFRSSLTFGSMKQGLKNSLTSSQQFIEQKKIKHQILDEIVKNAKKNNNVNMKSQGKLESVLICANNDGRKAKYRIISQQDDEQNLYYCSKCSIMLLQQGFQIEEITQKRKTQLAKRKKQLDFLLQKAGELQGRLKYHVNSLNNNDYNEAIQIQKRKIQDTYDAILFVIEQMKQKDLENLQLANAEIEKQKYKEKSRLAERLGKLEGIRQQLESLSTRLQQMSDGQAISFLERIETNISSMENYCPLQFSIKQQTLQNRLQRLINQVHEYFINNKKYTVQFSFEKSSLEHSKIEDDGNFEQTRKPFRNLFPQDEVNGHKKQNSRYLQDNSFSPSFRRNN